MFHTHYFKPSEKDPEMLYCQCGQVKDIHRHIWEKYKTTSFIPTGKDVAEVRKCIVCGELKTFDY